MYVPRGSGENILSVLEWCLNMEPYERNSLKISMFGAIGDDAFIDEIIKVLKILE